MVVAISRLLKFSGSGLGACWKICLASTGLSCPVKQCAFQTRLNKTWAVLCIPTSCVFCRRWAAWPSFSRLAEKVPMAGFNCWKIHMLFVQEQGQFVLWRWLVMLRESRSWQRQNSWRFFSLGTGILWQCVCCWQVNCLTGESEPSTEDPFTCQAGRDSRVPGNKWEALDAYAGQLPPGGMLLSS